MSKDLPGLSASSLKMDMMHFKDEILHDMRQNQTKFDTKYVKIEENLNENLSKFELKIKSLEQKIFELSNLITNDNSLKNKVESLVQFKEEMQDTIFKRRAKFSELEKKVNEDIGNINHILTNSVIYPGIIGKSAKFINFHDFIDFCIQEINQLVTFKNKSGIDIAPFKKKIENSFEAFRLQVSNLVTKETTNQMLNDLESRINNNLKIYNDKIQSVRVENSNYSIVLQKKTKELNKQIENLMNAQLLINRKLEKIQNLENINILTNEVVQINYRINKMYEIIMELIEMNPEYKKNIGIKSTKQIISGVKQYIKGNLNAEELSSMKLFSYEKPKGSIYEKGAQTQKTSLNTSPDSLFYKFPFQKMQNNYLETKTINFGEDSSNIVNKKFITKKTSYFSNKENNKFSESVKTKKKPLLRKNTFNVGKKFISETAKMNNILKKMSSPQNIFLNGQISEKDENIIEEENELNNSNHSIHNFNKNEYQIYKENENNKVDKIKKVKIMINNNDDKNDDISKEEIDAFKVNNSEDLITDDIKKDKDNINVTENEKLDKININNNIQNNNLGDDKRKKSSLTNSNKKDKIIITNDNIKRENSIKNNILTENDYKNNHARNKETLTLNKKDFFSEQNDTNTINTGKSQPILYKINIQNNNESPESMNLNSDEKENKNHLTEDNKILIPIKYDFKPSNPDINILSIKKKLNKTYTDFPKLNHNSSDNKIKSNDNKIPPVLFDNYTKTIFNEDKYYKNKNITKNPPIIKANKKVLLMSPDDLPLNYFDKAYKDIFKNNLKGSNTDRSSYNSKGNKGINLLNKGDINFKDYSKNKNSTNERESLLINQII